MKKYFFCTIILVFTILFCLGFINRQNSDVANDNLEETISYGINEIPGDLEKVTKLSKRHEDIMCALSKGLVSKSADNKIVPSLASDVVKDKDGIQYEFKMRDDIFWSDGSKITASDIANFFKELLKEEDEVNIQALLEVYGAKEFRAGKAIFENGVAIRATENSVIIRLNQKNEEFLSELTKPQYRLRKYLIMWRNLNNNYDKLVYSGDYKIDSVSKENMVLKRNNNNSELKISNINILNDENVELSMASYEVKERDIVINPPESELNKLAEENNLISIPEAKAAYLVMNSSDNSLPVQGRREIYNNVCKAIESYQNLNNKEFELAEGSFFREDKKDLTKLQARKVVSNKEGKWDKPKVLTLLGEDSNENRILCRVIQEWFKNNTDITIKYSLVKEEFKDEELRKRYDMILVNNEASILDKTQFYSNFKEYLTDSQSKLLEKSKISTQNLDYSGFEESIFDNYNVLPLVFYNENIAISDKISELKLDGNGNLDFATIK
ncbi:ABC transporter substrate-binding protein [Clostridium chromiireducens]|uniref:Oligopeptide-binding protein OppA n=1 Tax=Clostridium chromiireducens TaxID=225345 RepID=A0A1V4ITW5_9CLOT|nr:ABC transporter substrate-binding protein [Clostridium chromiireducens]OPJ63481.1 oligopeptide-binding protein OppA precursor [Clostridium chromiireducens]RII32814.1 peptide ABC transporter substrate-binding protein [Clostridium chromiireducens]